MKHNQGEAIQGLKEAMAQGKPLVTSVILSASLQRWEVRTMAALVARGDTTDIISYPEPLEKTALSLMEHEGFTTIDVRRFEDVTVYVIERVQRK